MTQQTQRWCVIVVPDSVESRFRYESEARARHEQMISDGAYDPDQIYVALVTMAWSDENRVYPKVEGE
jgi:hypothetical protein